VPAFFVPFLAALFAGFFVAFLAAFFAVFLAAFFAVFLAAFFAVFLAAFFAVFFVRFLALVLAAAPPVVVLLVGVLLGLAMDIARSALYALFLASGGPTVKEVHGTGQRRAAHALSVGHRRPGFAPCNHGRER